MEIVTGFTWSDMKSKVAVELAKGLSPAEIIRENEDITVSESTIYNWKQIPAFAMEVDKLTFMYGYGSKAERMRLINKAIRQYIRDDMIDTGRTELIDWMREARMNVDGVRLDIAHMLAAVNDETGLVAGNGSEGSGQDITEETTPSD